MITYGFKISKSVFIELLIMWITMQFLTDNKSINLTTKFREMIQLKEI